MKWTGKMPFAEYRADDINRLDTWQTVAGKSISKSLVCDFIDDPSVWRNSPSKKQTASMQAGSVLDCLLTEPESFENRYVFSIYDEFRTNQSKAWRHEIELSGRVVITRADFDTAESQLAAIYDKREAAKLLDGAQYQIAFKHGTKYPFGCKGLIDILPSDGETIVDLKTCDARALESHRSLSRYIYDWGYHVQAGAYCDGYSIASGDERTRFKFIFVGSTAPYTVAVVELPYCAISHGSMIYFDGVEKFAKCIETNIWPSIWDGSHEIDIPQYAYNQ